MLHLYPALRLQMGLWNYYVVKMTARQLVDHVRLVSAIYDDGTCDETTQRTFDEEIQRTVRDKRVRKEIVEYLKRQPYRFFSSIVIAALGGNPMFYPVEITEDPHFAISGDDLGINEAFGLLKFDGNQTYYAIDGQHRLSAIKILLDQTDSLSTGGPENLENDEFSVLVVVPSQGESNETFRQKYRRLFSNLNRYAKPTDQATNIIMDEDDTFAILTRRLVTNNDFFKSDGIQKKSERIKTKTKNLTSNDTHFTSLETLYDMNIKLLSSPQREPKGWGQTGGEGMDLKTFKRFRPSEDYIDSLYDELTMYWEALLTELPILRSEPTKMRIHDLLNRESDDETDHLLFWPIGQQMLAEIARELLNQRLHDPENPTPETVRFALKGLNQLEWQLHQPPWVHFLLIWSTSTKRWNMRSEERAKAVRWGRIIQQWILGLEDEGWDFAEDLKNQWKNFLIPAQSEETVEESWQQIVDRKSAMTW